MHDSLYYPWNKISVWGEGRGGEVGDLCLWHWEKTQLNYLISFQFLRKNCLGCNPSRFVQKGLLLKFLKHTPPHPPKKITERDCKVYVPIDKMALLVYIYLTIGCELIFVYVLAPCSNRPAWNIVFQVRFSVENMNFMFKEPFFVFPTLLV